MSGSKLTFANAEILASKICHDLAGSIGAVHNGMEMLRDGDQNDHEMLDFIERNAEELIAKLRLFRFIYGYSAINHRIKFGEVGNLLSGYFKGGKIRFEFSPQSLANYEDNIIRVRLVGIFCLLIEKALIGGGSVKINFNEALSRFDIVGEGNRIKIHDYISVFMANGNMIESVTTDNILASLAKELMNILECAVSCAYDDKHIRFICAVNNG